MALVTGDVTDRRRPGPGLFVDGWPERIPASREKRRRGVPPRGAEGTRAAGPAAGRLPRDPRRGWDDASLAQVLRETLALAQVRTVDLGSAGQAGQLLPALYFPFNLEEDTVSMITTGLEQVANS